MIDIGKKIRERRKVLGMTGVEVAKAVGIGQSTLSQIENGTSPTLDTLFKICNALSIKPSELLADENEPSLPPDLLQLMETAKKLTPEERKNLNVFLQSTLERTGNK
ncbi:helix-turn-helix transcriptional regulator [Aneurinibacillus thermoaerophilus]|uniref:helix-turn-helix domain-containing protein n=1 Tax=Aneurinibacillus thermoaerophilus TaxID=143495 RepID=UPI002E1E32D6|nr:helix-turn-helix transcriptional regulator [Aneurinibacillus thermoaerophilus]